MMYKSIFNVVVFGVVILVGCGGGKAGAGDYKLKVSVNPTNGGSISIYPNKDTYNEWENVNVTVEVADGYVFTGWSGDGTSESEKVTIKMSGNKNKKLTANFISEKEFEAKQEAERAKQAAEKAKELAKLREKFKSYKYTGRTVKIGNQTWTAENINNEGGGKCYDNDPSNCAKYGRLYTWAEALVACPSGWHLPSDVEWTALEDAVGGSKTADRKLKSRTGWNNNGNGTDDFGFSALPGGTGNSGGSFNYAGNGGYWWSATEGSAGHAWSRDMGYLTNVDVYLYYGNESGLRSVRCLQD